MFNKITFFQETFLRLLQMHLLVSFAIRFISAKFCSTSVDIASQNPNLIKFNTWPVCQRSREWL